MIIELGVQRDLLRMVGRSVCLPEFEERFINIRVGRGPWS